MSHHTTIRIEKVTLHSREKSSPKTILDDISFTSPAGKITALLGPSGAGKSSLLRLMCRLDDPDEGRIFLDEKDISDIPVLELRLRVGMVFQIPVMFPGTVRHNLEIAQKLCRTRECMSTEGLLDLVDLSDDYLERQAENLSVGEKQRVQLARVLVSRPEVLLLDEPTSGLDVMSAERIVNLIKRINKETGTSVVLVTHLLEQASALADYVALVSEGRLVREAEMKGFLKWAKMGKFKLAALMSEARNERN
ncbi:ATP-binding cassette domain-containing protein [candidate division WOR-3 bacterium]|nr:ATP-binding cassette domain-containing protein [candidate division WOR-3 bacterium]